MRNVIYTVIAILIALWAIGYFGYQTGRNTHILLVIAVLLTMIQVIRSRRSS
jgi:hypothetical protein